MGESGGPAGPQLPDVKVQPEGFIEKADGIFQKVLKVPDLIGCQAQGDGHGAEHLRLGALYFL